VSCLVLIYGERVARMLAVAVELGTSEGALQTLDDKQS